MEEYDVVIIGSGLGGLSCGAILAREGYKVCVLEKNKQIGGALQTFVRDRVIFDSGVHYVGGLDPGQNLHKIFRFMGIMDKLRIQRMDEDCFDAIAFQSGDKVYRYGQGYERFIKNLCADFPEERAAIEHYCDTLRDICSKFPLYNLRSGDAFEKAGILEIDTYGYIRSITSNERLQNVLAATNVLYAGIADKTPLYVHALVINSYIESSYRFVNGGSQIAKYLSSEIYSHGGLIVKHAQVTALKESGGRLEYAETAEGKRYYAKQFISNVHPQKTIEILQSDLLKVAYKKRIAQLENSVSTFCVNVVLKEDSFPYLKHNYYYFALDNVWGGMEYTEESWPTGYAMFFSLSHKTGDFACGVSIMAYMHYSEVAQWADTFNTVDREEDRGADYEDFKRRKSEKLFDMVEERFPGFRDCVEAYYAFTPLTIRDYIGSDDGSLYGIMQDYKDPLKTFISPRTKIPNLLLTGQNLNLHGVLGVAVSSIVTCGELLGLDYLIDKINRP